MTDNQNILCVLSWDQKKCKLWERDKTSLIDFVADTNELLDSHLPNQVSGVTREETKRQKP